MIAPHEAVVPFVVRYFPALPVCEGRLTGAAAQVIPFVAVDDAVRMKPSVPTPRRAAVSAAEATIKSPLASKIVAWIAEAACEAAALAELAETRADAAEVEAAVAEAAALAALVDAAVAEAWTAETEALAEVALTEAEAADVEAAIAEAEALVAEVLAAIAEVFAAI